MHQTIANDRFLSFVDNPTCNNFRSVQKLVSKLPEFDPKSNDLRALNALFQDGQFEQVLEKSGELFEVWKLSPLFHFVVGNAALECGELELANFSKQASRACLDAMLATGDGSFDAPFQITYQSDEFDILTAISADVRCRELVETTEGYCDVATCHDGSEVWFDIDLIFPATHSRQSQTRFAS